MKKQSPLKPSTPFGNIKPPKPQPSPTFTEAAMNDRRELQKAGENYTCQLPKNLSQQTRNVGIQEGKNVWTIVFEATKAYVQKKIEEQNSK